jgi:hypothetical protein
MQSINILYLTPLAVNFLTVLTLIGLFVCAISGAVIGWKMSTLFIPPRDNWTKSYFTVLMTRLGIALGGAFLAVWGVAALVSKLFS